MMVEINSKALRRCDLVEVSGRVDSANVNQLGDALNEITEAGRYKIVLNMAKIDYISSAGLRVLVDTLKNCKRFNRGDLVLCEVSERVQETLELAGLTSIFTIFNTETEAVGSF